jgi:fructose-bisphosphate aldolase class I
MEMAMNPPSPTPSPTLTTTTSGTADVRGPGETPDVELGGDAKRDAAPAAMEAVIKALMARGKGLLAADESAPTIEARFRDIGLVSTEEHRRAYREMLFTAPGLHDYISGVILFDETIHQRTRSGVIMPELLSSLGIIPGIKVDLGTVRLAQCPGETMTQGLDGLRERLLEYRRLGARFTKWRAVIPIADGIPSSGCIAANATQLALFAALSQEAGLVPIVEPEMLMHGTHSIARCEYVTTIVLTRVFDALRVHRVDSAHMLLKTGMVLSGSECPEQAGIDQVAETTIRCLLDAVPASVPGIVFLSGGQGEDQATERLNAVCRIAQAPWPLSFSFGRALQSSALKLWNGSSANTAGAQTELLRRAQQNGRATTGIADTAMAHR